MKAPFKRDYLHGPDWHRIEGDGKSEAAYDPWDEKGINTLLSNLPSNLNLHRYLYKRNLAN